MLFTAFADSSLNFELAVCIDVRHQPEKVVKSNLYFAIFEEFKKAGIEIPFPQQEIRIRSGEERGPDARRHSWNIFMKRRSR